VSALDHVWDHGHPYAERLAEYQDERDARTMPMYEFTCELARLEPPPEDMARLLAAVSRSAAASGDFVSVIAGIAELPSS
jgi:hypothetical protein